VTHNIRKTQHLLTTDFWLLTFSWECWNPERCPPTNELIGNCFGNRYIAAADPLSEDDSQFYSDSAGSRSAKFPCSDA